MPITLGHYFEEVYSRHDDGKHVENKYNELISQVEKITQTEFNSKDWRVVENFQYDGGDKFQCLCSQLGLHDLYIVEHIPTGKKFSIGSSCINQFGNETLSAAARAEKRNNRCDGGYIIKNRRIKPGCWGLCDESSCTACMSKRCKADNCNKYLGNNYPKAKFCSVACREYARYMKELSSPFVPVEIILNKFHKESFYFNNLKQTGVLRWSHEEQEWQCREYAKEGILRWWRGY